MRVNIVIFFLGHLLASHYFPWFTQRVITVTVLLLLLVLGCFYYRQNRLIRYPLLLSLGVTWFILHQAILLQQSLNPTLQQHSMSIVATIRSLPVKQGRLLHFRAHFDHLTVRLSWYQHHYPRVMPLPGQIWRFTVVLKPPHGYANPGAFDYQQWLRQQGIQATGRVLSGQLLSVDHMSWRADLWEHLQPALQGVTQAPLLLALILGYRGYLSTTQWHILQVTGTEHLIAIAGLHIGFLALCVYSIVGFVLDRFPGIYRIIPKLVLCWLTALLATISYTWLSGYHLPAQRANIMLAILVLAQCARYALQVSHWIALTLLTLLLLEPLQINNMSFWLSLFAVSILFYLSWGRQQRLVWYQSQLLLSFAFLPLSIWFFHQGSLVAPLANAVAIPMVTMFVVPLCLLACVALLFSINLSHFFFQCASGILVILWHYLTWLAQWPWHSWSMTLVSLPCLIVLLVSVIIILLPRGLPGRSSAVLLMLAAFAWQPARPGQQQLWLTLLDVGQGLSVVIETQHHTLVYDAGPKFVTGFNAGKAIILPFLAYRHIKQLDELVISHGDNDHIGGAQAILQGVPVRRILTSVPKRFTSRVAVLCQAQQHWTWDGISFRFLYPFKGYYGFNNNSSCVLQISDSTQKILLTGDIEQPVENILQRVYGKQLQSNLLVVPHHGSATSSSPGFLQSVQPQLALISSGFLNRFHFPADRILHRYQHLGSRVLTTARCGAISVHLAPQQPPQVKTMHNCRFDNH